MFVVVICGDPYEVSREFSGTGAIGARETITSTLGRLRVRQRVQRVFRFVLKTEKPSVSRRAEIPPSALVNQKFPLSTERVSTNSHSRARATGAMLNIGKC